MPKDSMDYTFGFSAGLAHAYDAMSHEGLTGIFADADGIRDPLQELDNPFRVQYYYEKGDRSVGIGDAKYFFVTPNPDKVVCLTRQEADLIRQHLSRVPMDPEERTNLYAALGRP